MKTSLHSWLGTGLLLAAALVTTPLSAQTLIFQENFDGPNYTLGQPIPVNPSSPWTFYAGSGAGPKPTVMAIEADIHSNAPTVGNMIHGVRSSGEGSHSGVYFSNEKLQDGGSYEWSLKYRSSGSANYVYLDTNSGQTFAGFYISGTSLYYYSEKSATVGTFTQAKLSGTSVVVEKDVWYDISISFDVRAEGSELFLDTTYTFTALGTETPLFQITLEDVTTNASLANKIRMGISPQQGADFMMAEVSVAAIPEPTSVAMIGTAGLLMGVAALRRKSRSL